MLSDNLYEMICEYTARLNTEWADLVIKSSMETIRKLFAEELEKGAADRLFELGLGFEATSIGTFMGIQVERDERIPEGQFYIFNKRAEINVPEIKFHTDSPYEIVRVHMGKEDYIMGKQREPFRYIEPNTFPTGTIGRWDTKEYIAPPGIVENVAAATKITVNADDIAWGKWNPAPKKPRRKNKTDEQEPEEISDEAFMNIINI